LAASVLNAILNNQLGRYGGDLAISAMGIIWAIVMFIAMPIIGINQGVQPIIGFNYGARKYDRVLRALLTAILAATLVSTSGFLVVMIFPERVIALFSRNDPALRHLGTHAMRTCLLMLPIVGFQIVSANYFQAVGKPKKAMLLTLSRQVLLLIPAVLILPHFFGLNGLWAAFPAADLGSSLWTGAWLLVELRYLRRRAQAPRPTPVAN
jgi:Na+-driven multidrug efflux pump